MALTNLPLGYSNPLAGHGGYTFATHTAWLALDARNWTVPHAGSNTLNLDLDVWCDPSRVHLEQLYLNSGMLSAYGNGEYVYNLPKPVSAHLYFTESPQFATAEEEAEPFRGNLRGNLDLTGTLQPADLTVTGAASGVDVHLGQRPLGNMTFALEGNVRDGVVSLASHDIKFLGGDWTVSGQWPFKNTLLHLDTVRVEHLSLPLALAHDDVTGQLDGNWSVDIRQFNPSGIFVQGSAVISNLVVGGTGPDSASTIFAADQIQLPKILLEDGQLDIKHITLLRKMSNVEGHATGELSTTLANPSELSIKLNASSWPVHPGNANLLCAVSTKAKVDIDVKQLSTLGHLDLSVDSSWDSHPLGRVDGDFRFQSPADQRDQNSGSGPGRQRFGECGC